MSGWPCPLSGASGRTGHPLRLCPVRPGAPIRGIRRFAAFLFELAELLFLPAPAAFGKDAREQVGGWLGLRMLLAPFSGERALDRRLEQRDAIELQLVPHALQRPNPGIEVGQQFVERIGAPP
jgi:hypothetical protein